MELPVSFVAKVSINSYAKLIRYLSEVRDRLISLTQPCDAGSRTCQENLLCAVSPVIKLASVISEAVLCFTAADGNVISFGYLVISPSIKNIQPWPGCSMIHPFGFMTVCTTFPGNPFKSNHKITITLPQ